MHKAMAMPATCIAANKKPDWLRLKDNCCCNTGMVGGSLPMCIAATMPAAMTNHGADADCGCWVTFFPLFDASMALFLWHALIFFAFCQPIMPENIALQQE